MPFTLSPMLEEDIDDFAIVDERAMENVPIGIAMQEDKSIPRRVFAAEWTRKDWGKDPNKIWMKVTDDETGEMAAAAFWGFHPEGYTPEERKKEAGLPAEGEGKEDKVKDAIEKEEEKEKQGEAKEEKPSIWLEMGRSHKEFCRDFIKDQPVALLHILVTDPKFQRRGAGSMLVKWGCDRADEQGLLASLQATVDGEKVYTRFGFEIVRLREMDLRPYGVDHTEVRRGMLRKPIVKQTS